MLSSIWEQTKLNTHTHIAPSTLVDRGKRLSFVPIAATRIEGVSYLIEYSAVGSLSAASTRRQEPVKQPLGVVATGLDVWARLRRVPQAEKSWRVGNLKLKPVTKPTP